MNLRNIFKREKTEEPAAVAVAPRPTVEKPASERFGKTVMPSATRVAEADSRAPAPSSPRSFSLGDKTPTPALPRTASQRAIALQLTELLPQIPAELLTKTEIEPEHRVVFNAADLERGMANGRPAVLLRSIYQQAPAIFSSEISATDTREIALPFQRVLEQFTSLQQPSEAQPTTAIAPIETSGKVAVDHTRKAGAPIPAARVVTLPAVAAPSVAPAASAPAPIRLSLPAEPPPSSRLPIPAKIFPNGAGAPTTERVPASSGSPVPTPLPAPLAPARVPFKITPPASDLCPPPMIPLRPAESARTPLAFSENGPRVRLSLRVVLRGIPPFQLTGPIDQVPEDAQIELPFGVIATQLSLGKVAISPAQFHAAMPEQFRSLYKLDAGGVPVALPLPDILQNLPNDLLQLRPDQEQIEIAPAFETPFSQKAAEDAERLKGVSGPVVPASSAQISASVLETEHQAITPEPAPRSALQLALETEDTLDIKSIVTHVSRLPGVSACAIMFSDGLSLAGNLPAEYAADALCAIAPEIVKRIDTQTGTANLGAVEGITVFCAKATVSFFAHENVCLAALHSGGNLVADTRDRLGRTTRELAQLYAQPTNA